jgi:hypothetical protein
VFVWEEPTARSRCRADVGRDLGGMITSSVDELIAAESRLNRSMLACLVAFMAGVIFLNVKTGGGGLTRGLAALVLLCLQVGCYVWYALAAGAAAKILGEARWKYVAWILVAPFLALVPFPMVSTLIGLSPLAIKFLLGGQLKTAIRERPFAD